MPNMIGLVYTGHREEGISLMLFRSYKTVTISKRKPYRFTERDNISQEAMNYYNVRCKQLNIKVVTDPAELQPTSTATTRKQGLEAEKDKQIDVQTPAITDPPVPADPPVADSEDQEEVEAELGSTSSNTSSDQLAEMNDAELSEYLDMNYDKQGLKELISAIDAGISIGRKNESTLINELVSNHKDAVIAYLKSK